MLTITEAAKELGVSRQTVLNYVKSGRIKAHRYVKEYRIAEEEIKRFKEVNAIV